MALKRGQSGLSFLVGINKPLGLSSHDVVNKCRYALNEKRIGHSGTLDPQATGVMLMCIGPATRLNKYLSGQDKSYNANIVFGYATDTDDSEGNVTERANPVDEVFSTDFAKDFLSCFTGLQDQMPPAYSAIKVGGAKACDEARKGRPLKLDPRLVDIKDIRLKSIGCNDEGLPCWNISTRVSKGTYIRSLARDIGERLGCPAHLGSLMRTASGPVTLNKCIEIPELEEKGSQSCLDPFDILHMRIIVADDDLYRYVVHGQQLPGDIPLKFQCPLLDKCGVDSRLVDSHQSPKDSELVCIMYENKLLAIYKYDMNRNLYIPDCVFSAGVSRGQQIL